MEFSIPQEYLDFRGSIYRFAKERLAPRAADLDARAEFSWENWREMGSMGLLGLPFPERYGGSDATPLATCIAMEVMGSAGVDAGTSLAWGAHTVLCGIPIWLLGTEEQRARYLPKICTGELVGAFALTEPGSGSDAAALTTTARLEGDRWVLNGSKMFITNGPIADVVIVFATTNQSAGNRGISAFIVERGFPGFSSGKDLVKMGNRSSATSEILFEDCEVPNENLLGPLDLGFLTVGKETLEWERSCLIAPLIGSMEYTLRRCAEYSKNRRQFGQPIGEFQAIQHKLVDMRVAIEGARLLVYRVAWLKQQGKSAMMEAAIAKLWTTEAAVKVAYDGVQIFGGYGYMQEYPVERFYRDARLSTIGAGTSEVQKMIIAGELIRAHTRK